MKAAYVLDSFAILVYLEDEPGGEIVERLLADAEKGKADHALSLVNWGEVLYSVRRAKGKGVEQEAERLIDQLPITLVAPDRDQTRLAAQLKAQHPIAYADCFAAALAVARKAKVVTGDPEFRRLEGIVPIRWLAR